MESKKKEATRVNAQEQSHSSVHNSAHNPEFTNSKFPPLTELEKDSLVERNPIAESAHMLGHRLLEAAEKGDAKEVLNLIRQGADVNVRNPSNVTPLMCAARKGHTKICRILVENGADVNATDDSGETALIVAVKSGRVGVVRFLKSVGANPLVKNVNGDSVDNLFLRSRSVIIITILAFSLDNYIKLWKKKLNPFGILIRNKQFRTPKEFKAAVKACTMLHSLISPAIRNCSPDRIKEIFTNL